MSTMEDAFELMNRQGNATLDGILQWMKDAKIIDGKKITEERVRQGLDGVDFKGIDFMKFKRALNKLAVDHKESIDEITKKLTEKAPSMEEAFEQLRKDGKNSVDNLVTWLKDSKLIDGVKVTEDMARKLLETADKQNVELEKFKDVLTKIAIEHKKSMEELNKTLSDTSAKMIKALQAGLSAFKDALK